MTIEEILVAMGYAEGGMVETPAQEAIADTVQNPNAARMLDMDLANLAVMNQQPQRMSKGGLGRKVGNKILPKAERDVNLSQEKQFDISHFDPTIIQRVKKDFGDMSKLSDAEYQQALAERANQYRIESILSKQGFDTSGYSNLSGSSYHNRMVGTEYDPKYGWIEKDTHQVRLSNHPDYHPPIDEDIKQRFNINHAIKPSTWEDYHIYPSMTDEQVHKILSGLDIPKEPDINKAQGGAVKMAEGGEVDQAELDRMRLELNSPVIQATPQTFTQRAIGTLGGYMNQAGEFVSEAIKPLEERNPVKHFLADMFLAGSLKGAGTALQDYTKTSRDYTEDNPYKRAPITGSGQTMSLDPRMLDVIGFANPVARVGIKGVRAGAKAVTPFAKDVGEMASEMYMLGKIPGTIKPALYVSDSSTKKINDKIPTEDRAQLEEFKRKAKHNEQLRNEYLKEYHQSELADILPYDKWLEQKGKKKMSIGGKMSNDAMRNELTKAK